MTVARPASEKCESARQRLLEIAGEIFAERGFEAATVKEITDRAGINVASVNYYFRDKFSLYLEVLRYSVARRELFPPEAEGKPAEERLARFIRGFMRSMVAQGRAGWYGRIMVRELAQPTPALPQVVEEIIRPNFNFLRDLVAEVAGPGVGAGMVRLLTYSILAQCAHWKISEPIFVRIWPELRMDEPHLDEMARHIADFSLAGIRGIANARSKRPARKRAVVKRGGKSQ